MRVGVALDPEQRSGTAADLPPVPVAELEALRQGFAAAEAALRRRTEAERRAYATLAEKEAMLASAQQLTGVGGWTWEMADPAELESPAFDDKALRWTEETYRIFGLAPGAAITTGLFFEAVPPADRPRIRARLQEALRSGRPYRIEHRIRRPDGTVRIVEELASPEQDGDGRVRRVVGSCQDVTERRLAEAALADNAARLQDLLSTLDLAAAMARDVDGTDPLLVEGLRAALRLDRRPRRWAATCTRCSAPSSRCRCRRSRRPCCATATGAASCAIAAATARRWWWRRTRRCAATPPAGRGGGRERRRRHRAACGAGGARRERGAAALGGRLRARRHRRGDAGGRHRLGQPGRGAGCSAIPGRRRWSARTSAC